MKGKLRSVCCSLVSLCLVFSTLFPPQLAFALLKDCGAHVVELCEDHHYSHLKVSHGAAIFSESKGHLEDFSLVSLHSSELPHDDAHEIDLEQPMKIQRLDFSEQ